MYVYGIGYGVKLVVGDMPSHLYTYKTLSTVSLMCSVFVYCRVALIGFSWIFFFNFLLILNISFYYHSKFCIHSL